jgi:hypothetical protein
MTSTDHYLEAERLLEHAASMPNTDVHPEDSAELFTRQGVIVAMASTHAALAGAAVAGLSAHLDTADTQAWRRAAGTPLGTKRARRRGLQACPLGISISGSCANARSKMPM